jgi:glycogen operon protein
MDWAAADRGLLEFVKRLSALRRVHPVFRRRGWFQGRPIRRGKDGKAMPDIAWLDPDGAEMTDEQWDKELSRSLQVVLNGAGISTPNARGEPILDDTFVVVFHAHPEGRTFKLPRWGKSWRRVLDTSRGFAKAGNGESVAAGGELAVPDHSLWVFRLEPQ